MIFGKQHWKISPWVAELVAKSVLSGTPLPDDLFERVRMGRHAGTMWVKFNGFRFHQNGRIELLNGERAVMELDFSAAKEQLLPGESVMLMDAENTAGRCKFKITAQ